MRDVRYKNFAAIGRREARWQHALLDEFLLNTPLFWYELRKFGVIPPLHVLNEKLSAGECDAGMSGSAEWKPFELTNEEYEELEQQLLTNPEHANIQDKELWSRPNFDKWFGALLSKYGRKQNGEL